LDPLSVPLNLNAPEKQDSGLEHTPQEIAQQPETWRKIFAHMEVRLPLIQRSLKRAGTGAISGRRSVVFPIGADTSERRPVAAPCAARAMAV
jgi:D-galactosamine 6-phosphate deaminase/isomerase